MVACTDGVAAPVQVRLVSFMVSSISRVEVKKASLVPRSASLSVILVEVAVITRRQGPHISHVM